MMNQEAINSFFSHIQIEGTRAYLPAIRISPADYTKYIKRPLDNLGGKWNSSNQCYDFSFDPSVRIGELASGIRTNLRSEFHYYGTNIDLVGNMLMFSQEAGLDWQLLNFETAKVLEPSAGQGNILKVLNVQGFKNISYFELMPENRQVLSTVIERLQIPAIYLGDDFLKGRETGFDLIVANPPFRNDRKHIEQMFSVAKPEGIVLTLASENLYHDNRFCSYLDRVASKWEMRTLESDPEDPLFEGTLTGCTMIAARKRNVESAAGQLRLLD